MIQRIQSIYLLVASLVSGVLVFFTNFWYHAEEKFLDFIDLFSTNSYFIGIGSLFFLSSLLSFVSIFMYHKRKRQILLGRVNMILNILIIFSLIFYSQNLSGEPLVSVKGIGIFIPFITIAFLILGNRAIKRDEELVKSVDRLR